MSNVFDRSSPIVSQYGHNMVIMASKSIQLQPKKLASETLANLGK
jgi:hypothetical protein